MKKLAQLALVALVFTLPTLASAQGYRGRSYGPPARDSWYIGFGLGTGDGSASGQGERYSLSDLNVDDPTNVFLNFKAGATLTPQLLLGGDLTYLSSQASAGGYDSSVGIMNVDLVATFFPMERGLFFRGGLGRSAYVQTADGYDDYNRGGWNVLGGVGYAFWLGQRFNLTVNLDVSQQWYGSSDVDVENSRFWALYAGFDWY